MPALALFDFDGTITRKDSFPAFLKKTVGITRYYLGMMLISPLLGLYFLKIIPNHTAKMLVLRYFLEGWFKERLEHAGKEFCEKNLPSLLRPAAMEKIQWHLQQGHRVVIISASVDWWLKPWCDAHHLELISTRMAYDHNRFSGTYDTPNCYGPEKVRRLKNRIPKLESYTEIYAYGDSRGDREMLAMAQHAYFKPFREE